MFLLGLEQCNQLTIKYSTIYSLSHILYKYAQGDTVVCLFKFLYIISLQSENRR